MKCLEQLKKGEIGSHILPFLWMKGEDNQTIQEEMDRIEECGIREICLESRPHPEFCGTRWWENLDFIIPEAKKRGMKIWILDDDKFPTGHANGGFERHPEYRKLYVAERHMDIMGPCKNSAVLVENFMQPDGELLGILACPKPDGETLDISPEGIIDLTDSYRDGFVFFDLPKGAYRLFILFRTHAGGGRPNYINLIDKRSVRVLLDEVYEKHYERYAEYFGNTIAGFFSDEPELGNINGYPFDASLGRRDARLPWSEELEKRLRQSWKETFLVNLPALWYGMGDKTPGVRSDYMEHMTDLVYECFSGQIGAWCEAHGVEYIGHIIEDDNAHTRLGCSIGHYFKEMKGQHMAGIDVVHHQIVPGFTERVHQWIAGDGDGEFFHYGLAKMGSSAAHLDPKKKNRALCEIFGNYGWAEGVSFMKWLTNHMLVRGINEFTPHAFSMSYPDRDCPPHFYARGNNPQFPEFVQLMKYMQRASHLLTSGKTMIRAAILYHAESEWTGKKTQFFQKPMRALMEHQIDADIVWADVLKEAVIKDAKLKIGENCYECLILPAAEYEKKEVAEFVIKAAAEGVKIFAIDQVAAYDCKGEMLPEGFLSAVSVVSLGELAENVAKHCSLLYQTTTPDPDLRVMGCENEEGQIYMFFNESVSKEIKTELLPKENGFQTILWYDAWNNVSEAEPYENGVSICLKPQEAAFCILKKEADEKAATWKIEKKTGLPLTWRVSRADELHYGMFEPVTVLEAGQELPNMNGPAFDPCFTGYYRYDGVFSWDKKEGSRYELCIPDGGDTVHVWINEKDFGYLAGFPVKTEITEALKTGENTIRLEFTTTLVWKRKDGASTHLQLFGTGLLADIELIEKKRK